MNTKLKPKALYEAMYNTQANISKILRKLAAMGIDANWHTIDDAIKRPREHFAYMTECITDERKRAKFEALLDQIEARYWAEKETPLDVAESNLMEALLKKEQWATKLILTTKGRARGYDSAPIIKMDNTDPLNINLMGDFMSEDQLRQSPTVEIGDSE
jgi:hypothetical protein